MLDELLDLVDEQDRVIGQLWRSEVYARNMSNFRAVNAFIINSQGQLWIPRRTKAKKLFPLALDASMGGHVGAGETYDQALARELMEELNLNVSGVPHKCLGPLNPHQHGTSAFMRVYAFYTDTAPNYNPNDFIEYYWLEPKEVLGRIERGDPCKSDLPRMIRAFFMS